MARRINAPGIELNEIDRSAYDQMVDNSTVGTATLVLGFADKGEDYDVKWVNTMNTFTGLYGTPTNEAESYFYNAAAEVVGGGGVCYAAKLPYHNDSFEKFTYTSYTVGSQNRELSSVGDLLNTIKVSNSSSSTNYDYSVKDVIFYPRTISSHKNYTYLDNSGKEWNPKTECPGQNAFMDYVREQINLDSDQDEAMDIICLSVTNRRRSTYIISSIINYDGSPSSFGKETDLSDFSGISSEISGIHDQILAAFGEKVNLSDIVDDFIDTIFLHQAYVFINDSYKYRDQISLERCIDPSLSDLWFTPYTELKTVDSTLNTYASIQADCPDETTLGTFGNQTMSYENYDKFLVKEMKVPKNKIYIVDATRGKYGKDIFGNECVGIMPVVTTPANALFYQGVIAKDNSILSTYAVIDKVRNCFRKNASGAFDESLRPMDQTSLSAMNWNGKSFEFMGIEDFLGCERFSDGTGVTVDDYTVSQNAAGHFPSLNFIQGRLDRQYLNQIGVVVYKLFKDAAAENRISFTPVESFVGSLDRYARDEYTGAGIFIDDVVNAASEYISLFSNADIPQEKVDDPLALKNADIYAIGRQVGCSLGFFERDMEKNIHVTESISKPMLKIFANNQDRNVLDIDILADAGITNIAQFIASTCPYDKNGRYVSDRFQREGKYDYNSDNAAMYKLESTKDADVWRNIIQRFDEFASNTRKDCIFIADGPRPFCLEGSMPIVRRTKPENTIERNILPKLKYISGTINSSYSAGYLNWFWSQDRSTGNYFWCPPSIKALGVYLYTDNMGAYWDAPAGLNRGRVGRTLNVAFNPTNDEAGKIYVNSWNYAVSYPLGGIVIEGQRTFQKDKTALDRVNVRRLMLGMEKTVRNFCRYFNYEGNTAFNRTRIRDTIERYLEQVRANDGISQFVVICDDRNNTVETIENNELHIAIAVRPVKSIEFIVLNFVCTNQSMDVSEAVMSEL